MQNVISILSNWKVKSLSIGGRVTLILSVLGVVPTYFMSLYKAPTGILSKLEALCNNFFLGSINLFASIRVLPCKWVWRFLSDKSLGGLGVSILFALNRALLFSWV